MSDIIIASDPKELVQAQRRMIVDIELKIGAAKVEAQQARDMHEQLQQVRLSPASAKALHRRATARVSFLTKVKSALERGYCMMPDLPGTIIGVRVDRLRPAGANQKWRDGGSFSVRDENPQGLPEGKGSYKSPRQTVHRQVVDRTDWQGKPVKVEQHRAVSLRDPDGLDRKFVRAEVISRTAGAMSLKLFDEIVCVDRVQSNRRDRDPVVLGRIVDPANRRVCAFLIAWFVDMDEIGR